MAKGKKDLFFDCPVVGSHSCLVFQVRMSFTSWKLLLRSRIDSIVVFSMLSYKILPVSIFISSPRLLQGPYVNTWIRCLAVSRFGPWHN